MGSWKSGAESDRIWLFETAWSAKHLDPESAIPAIARYMYLQRGLAWSVYSLQTNVREQCDIPSPETPTRSPSPLLVSLPVGAFPATQYSGNTRPGRMDGRISSMAHSFSRIWNTSYLPQLG